MTGTVNRMAKNKLDAILGRILVVDDDELNRDPLPCSDSYGNLS